MSESKWSIKLLIWRKKGTDVPHYDEFGMGVNPDEYVLDAIERVWAFHDRSLCFAHACHHSTCGACGMRLNGVEKLTCITPVKSVVQNGGSLKVEPLRNFPVISDLVVDIGSLFRKMDAIGHHPLISLEDEPAGEPRITAEIQAGQDFLRLSDCIECGLCMSACPAAVTSPNYLGPAPLAGAGQYEQIRHNDVLNLIDSDIGLWRCHSAFECSVVCPANVDPASTIMQLRRMVISNQIKKWFNVKV